VATLAVCSVFAARPDDRTPLLKTLDSLFWAARYDTLRVLLPGLIRDAEARGDSAALGRLAFQRGRVEITLGHQEVARGHLDRAIRLTESQRDTVGLLPALHFKAFILRDGGDPDAAMALFERELDLGRRAHIPVWEGAAVSNLAYRDLRRGHLDAAKAGYARMLQLYQRGNNAYQLAGAGLSMGMLHSALGNVDSCRYWYEQTLRLSRQRYPMHELWSLNNIGLLEADLGDHESAANYYQAALDIGRKIGFDRGQALPLMNLALGYSYLGENERAQDALDEAIEVCERAGFDDLEDTNVNALAVLHLQAGRNRQAAALFRRTVNRAFVFHELRRNEAAYGLALALAQLDSVNLAVQVLDPYVAPRVKSPDLMVQPYLELAYTELLRRQGHFDEALARAVRVRDQVDRAGRTDLGVSARLVESSCRRNLGDLSQAANTLTIALDSLEIARADAGEAEWREAYGQRVMNDIIEGCRVVLEYPKDAPRADRVRRFYDTLQRFKTRTLLERIRDPRGGAAPVAGTLARTTTVARLQQEVLRPGELLLDLFVSRHETYLFAVSPDSCRLVSLPGARSKLAEQVTLYADLLSASDRITRDAYPPERFAAVQRALGRVVLGPVEDLVSGATRVILAPDGFHASVPFATLIVGDDHALLETKDLVEVPSASVLEWARAKTNPARDAEITSIVAVTDGSASELRGAQREVGELERRYAHVDRVSAVPGALDTLARSAQPGRVLHIATHARVNDESPWQSGFMLGRASDNASFLRAWEIARAHLPYDVAVLAGCETAGGRATSGEGVLGLTSAFLSAGVPVVVSSRWPVDDRATATLMEHFYDHLAEGETVASSLRAAQLAVRSEKRTQHPFYWAGFAVVGDGSRVISPLLRDPRDETWPIIIAGTVVLFGAVGWAFRRRRAAPAPAR
jgi:tetratricopeptide (TPR) repeat protein